MKSPRVTAILVNYNRPDETIDCVKSLNNCTYQNLEILVVDNGSTGDSVSRFKKEIPEVKVIETGKNLGFTGGNNFGFEYLRPSPPEYLLILNNDTIVEPGFLEPLARVLEDDSAIAVAGGTVCFFHDQKRIWYAGGDMNFWRASSFSRRYRKNLGETSIPITEDVSFVTGCLMLVRASVAQNVGLFDDRFCMYLDDTELCLRMLRFGKRLVYVSESRIYHKVHHVGNMPGPLYFSTRNRLLILKLYAGTGVRIVGSLYLLLTTALKAVRWWFFRRDLFWAAWYGVVDYFNGEFNQGRGFELTFYAKKTWN